MIEPLVSVLSITYNHSPYIAHAIDSFLAQETTFPFEIVIGEDCSTDGTREIVFDYASRHPDIIRLVTSHTNVGVASNFQRTFRACRGKYIAICEGDDYWHHPGKLQMQVEFLEENPEYGMVHTDYDEIDLMTGVITRFYCKVSGIANHPEDANLEGMLLTNEHCVRTATILVKSAIMKSVIEEDPESFDGRYCVLDLSLAVGVAHKSKIKFLSCSTSVYRAYAPSAVSQNPNFKYDIYHVHMHLCSHYKGDVRLQAFLHRRRTIILMHSAFLASDIETAKKAMNYFWEHRLPIPLTAYVYFCALRWRLVGFALKEIHSLRRLLRQLSQALRFTLGL